METFVKMVLPKFLLLLKKIWVAQNLGGEGGGRGSGSPQLPRPVRSWVLSPVSSCKHIIISVKFNIIELGL